MIQGAYRRKMARRRLHAIAKKSYKKGFDPTTKRVFYYNLKSQKSFWEKPSTLPDDDDLKLTPRSEKLAIEAKAIVPPKPKTPRFTAETLSDEEAALHIQGIWRARKARKLLRKMIADVYVKKYDHESKKFYYVNKKSGESFWKKPLGLHSDDLVASARTEAQAVKDGVVEKRHRTPRVHAKDLSREDAALMIQGAYRRKMARRLLHQMASKLYTKSYDENSGRFYFTNKKTGESVWDPPKSLGDDEEVEMTPRSKAKYDEIKRKAEEYAKKHHTPRFVASQLSEEEAAIHLQQCWRNNRARKRLRHLVKHKYTKHYDKKSKAYYYKNNKTGQSIWGKPKLLKADDDLDLTPRSAEQAREDGLDVPTPEPKTVRFHSWNLTADQAAIHVQSAWRGIKARSYVQHLLQDGNVYRKGFDVHVKQFYWYNTRTGLSMWHRPRILGKHDPLLTPRSRKVAVAHGMKVRTKTPRYKATDMEPAFAATVIQCAFRCFKAQKIVIAHAQRVYQKGYDSEADCFFYFNTRTNTSQWHKPSFLHSADVDLTPRSFIGARRNGHVVARERKARFRAKDLSQDDAQKIISSWWRGYLGRRKAIAHISKVLVKGYDLDSGNFYWHNTKTGESRWQRPWFLHYLPLEQGSLPLTARTAMYALHGKKIRLGKRKQRKRAHEMTRYEASRKIQGMYRAWKARLTMQNMVKQMYEKLYDSERGAYYYHNKLSGASSWYKPSILGSKDLRRSFIHTGSLTAKEASIKAARAARLNGYTIGEQMLMQMHPEAVEEYRNGTATSV